MNRGRSFVVLTSAGRSEPYDYFADAIRDAAQHVYKADPPRMARVVTVRGSVEVVVLSYTTGPNGLPETGGAS